MSHDNIIILAGGPSVGQYQLPRLNRRGYVIGVNDSFLKHDCDEGITMDRLWMEHRHGEVLSIAKPFWTRSAAVKNLGAISDPIRLFNCKETNELNVVDPLQFNGINSGMCAINRAIHLKPKTIYLFGFDMTDDKGSNYWYKPYSWVPQAKLKKRRKYEEWVRQFDLVAATLKMQGITVKNVNHNSALKCFETITFNEFMRDTSCKGFV